MIKFLLFLASSYIVIHKGIKETLEKYSQKQINKPISIILAQFGAFIFFNSVYEIMLSEVIGYLFRIAPMKYMKSVFFILAKNLKSNTMTK